MSNEVNHAERGHSKLGASSMERWATCPASVRASEGIENKSSAYAAEGTAAHELGEMAILAGKDAKEYIGEEINGFEVTEEMAEAVQVYIDFVTEQAAGGKEVVLEQQFSLDYIDSELYGTSDCAIMEPFGTLHVIDYKHGKGIAVDAENNKQLLYYGLGAAMDGEYQTVKLTIVQPRADHPMGPIRTWEIDIDELSKFEKELKEAVKATRADNPPYKTSEKGCRFCLAKATCPEMKRVTLSTAKTEFDDVSLAVPPKPDTLTDEELVKVLKASRMMEDWLKEVGAYAQAKLESGEKVEGFKLVKKRANRKWRDEKEVTEEFGDIFDDSDLYAPEKLRTPAQLEKLVGKSDVARFTHTPDSGHTMVKASDKRPEIVLIEAKDEFND